MFGGRVTREDAIACRRVEADALGNIPHYASVVVVVALMLTPALYGLHLCVLAVIGRLRWNTVLREQTDIIRAYRERRPAANWPVVTTQIPLYNELAVAERVIEAVSRLDYPRDRHEIQVLDDSTDGTRVVVDRLVERLQRLGHDIRVIRRPTREHFKAGALAVGALQARGEYMAIFDSDFVPQRDFLRRTLPLIESRPEVCCVQGRWGHLNPHENWMTDALAVGMDGHFGIEQPGRAWGGFLLNFNGTAGIWRRAAILDPRVGGWQGDTITEDLDLSYRAQLAGWKIVFTPEVVAPAEVPADADAIKAQQRRWATGSIQTARKLLPRVWSSALTPLQKIEATLHLTQYAVNVFMIVGLIMGRPLLMLLTPQAHHSFITWLALPCMLAAVGSWTGYIYARQRLGGRPVTPLRLLKLITLGFGLSLSNTLAVLAGLRGRGGEFVRTPKSGSEGDKAVSLRAGPYRALRSRLWLAEIGLGGFCLAQWAWFLQRDSYVGGTFLLLYGIGLVLLGWHSRPVLWRVSPRPAGQRRAAAKPVDKPVSGYARANSV